MKNKREGNFEVLRILCVVLVILLHVNSPFYKSIDTPNIISNDLNNNVLFACIFNVITRIAVPCFVMLSGAFLISNDKNKNYKYLYSKYIKKIGIYTLIFSIIYLLYNIAISILTNYDCENIWNILRVPLLNFFKGEPSGHMWYLYMLIGLYLVTPVIIRLKNDIGDKKFLIISIVYTILASIGINTSSHTVHWDIGYQSYYIGYFMLGYCMRQKSIKKNQISAYISILISIVILIIDSIIVFNYGNNGITVENFVFPLISHYSPFIIIASVLLFNGFANLNIKNFNSIIAKYSFLIYLIHGGVWDLLYKVIKLCINPVLINPAVFIPMCSLLVLIVSLIISIIFDNIWNKMDNKYSISDKICKKLKLT